MRPCRCTRANKCSGGGSNIGMVKPSGGGRMCMQRLGIFIKYEYSSSYITTTGTTKTVLHTKVTGLVILHVPNTVVRSSEAETNLFNTHI